MSLALWIISKKVTSTFWYILSKVTHQAKIHPSIQWMCIVRNHHRNNPGIQQNSILVYIQEVCTASKSQQQHIQTTRWQELNSIQLPQNSNISCLEIYLYISLVWQYSCLCSPLCAYAAYTLKFQPSIRLRLPADQRNVGTIPEVK